MPRAPLSAYFCLAIVLLVALGAMAPANAANAPHLFGSDEVRSSDLRYFPKWTDMLERYKHEVSATHWDRFIDGLWGADPLDQLDQINRYMNDVPHKADVGNYAVADYWATPRQFFAHAGDCEDFAIAKYATLILAGVDVNRLRITYVKALMDGRNGNVYAAHMVLAYYAAPSADPMILDNLIRLFDNMLLDVRLFLQYF